MNTLNDGTRPMPAPPRWQRLGACALGAWLLLAALPARAADADGGTRQAAGDAGSDAQVERRLKEAQQRLEQAAREVAELSLSMSDGRGAPGERRILMRRAVQRAMLGMAIDMDDDAVKGGEGVRIMSVSPGGAAEAAGLRANDVVTSLGGKALKGDGKEGAQRQLLSIMRTAKAGEKMPIEYRRDGKPVKTEIVPKDTGGTLADFDLPDIDIPGIVASATAPVQRMFRFQRRMDEGFGSAELVELSPTLGSYFGTDKGLLVVRAPRDERFRLQDGDVLLDIDGRVPAGVSHALQILDSYRGGETAKLHVMRQRKRVELSVTLPTDDARTPRATPVPPTPPARPGSVTPPAPPPAPDRAAMPGATVPDASVLPSGAAPGAAAS